MSCCKLLCDHRERAVTIHAVEWTHITYHVQELTVGDYAVIDPSGRLLAVFERKTLDDFGASIKDARHDNKEKLVRARDHTGCRIVYIIENPSWPQQSDTFARIPYRAIESSIFHLILRENICVLRTRDSLDTARTLARFVQSCDTLLERSYLPDDQPAVPPVAVTSGVDPAATEANFAETIRVLTARHAKSDADVARAMWSRLRGITSVTADEYASVMSLRDLFTGAGAAADLTSLRLSNGKVPPARALMSLRALTAEVEAKVLGAVPGISPATAKAVVHAHRLRALLTFSEGAISIIKIPGKAGPRNLGMTAAKRILHYFGYRHVIAPAAPEN